jgi:hypothetical protein
MTTRLTPIFAVLGAFAILVATHAQASKATPVKVSPQTYIRAETDRQFAEIMGMAGGVNRFYHFRSPTPLDKQNVVRMNQDTLYSMGIVDTSRGASITVPELPRDRYTSVYLADNDYDVPFVIYTAGTHELPRDSGSELIPVFLQGACLSFQARQED